MDDIEIFENRLLTLKTGLSISKIQDIITEKNLKGIRIFDMGEEYSIDYADDLFKINNIQAVMLFGLNNYDFLYYIKGLKELTIQIICADLDLLKLPRLVILDSEWDKNFFKNLHTLQNLKYLSLGNFDGKYFEQITQLMNLEVLCLSSKNLKNISDINKLKELMSLFISDLGIQDISGIQNNNKLKLLKFSNCRKLNDISCISSLENLELLVFDNCKNIQSLKGLEKLKKLKQLQIWGTSKINDLDLSYIEHVENVFIQDPRKYNTKKLNKLNLYKNRISELSYIKQLNFYKELY